MESLKYHHFDSIFPIFEKVAFSGFPPKIMKLNYFAILTLGTVFGKPREHKNAVRLKKDVKSTSNGLVFTVTDLKKHPV